MGYGIRGNRLWVGAVLAALALAGTGCLGIGEAADDKPDQPVTIAFGGDVHFEGETRARLNANPDTAFGPIAESLRRTDLAMVNLETAITERGMPAPKQYTFRAPASAFRALKSAGVDVTSMANNHGMDYGEEGLADSLAAIKQTGFPAVGIGANAAEAYKPHKVTVKGTRIAIIGATQVLDDNLIQAWTATDAKGGLASAKNAPRLVRAVREARKEADAVIVYLHWGQERNTCATDVQRQLARQLADAGATAIVGGHAHVPLAGGFLGSSYVHYGLGNFVFYAYTGAMGKSGVLTLTLIGGKVTKADWAPAAISGGIPQPLTGTAAQQARTEWEALRRCADVKATPASAS